MCVYLHFDLDILDCSITTFLSSLCLCTYRSPLSSSHRTTTTTIIITSLFSVNMCVWVHVFCVWMLMWRRMSGVWKLLLSCFEKNVICVKVSFLTAIFFSSVSVCFALHVCLCVCVRSLQPRENIWYRYATKNHLFQIFPPGTFIRTAESARPSSRRNNSRSKRRQMTERE